MRHLTKFFFFCGLLALLNGCDISTSDSSDDITVSIINAFSVAGNVVDDADERIVLPLRDDNAQVSGLFDLNWDVVSSDPYSVEIYMSSNSVLDEATDGLFFQSQCGSEVDFTCEHSVSMPCGIHYDPEYEMVPLLDENNLIIVDENGDPVLIRNTNADGSFIVEVEHYYLRCPGGVATEWLLEITDQILISGFPSSHYFILKVCATNEQSCPELPFLVQLLDSQP